MAADFELNELEIESDEASLALVVDGHTLRAWNSYNFTDSFLTPADAFNFEVSNFSLSDAERRRLVGGAHVSLILDGIPQGTGYIDTVTVHATRGAGAMLSIAGRDPMGHVVDSNMDPRTKFKETQSLEDIARVVLEPFGFEEFVSDNAANRATKGAFHAKTSKKGRALKKGTIAAQLRPHEKEGCFAFLQRVANRFGLWVWPGVDGKTVIIGTPDFAQEPSGTIRRSWAGHTNNVLDGGEVKYDLTSQPSYVVAEAFGGGGEWGHAKLRVVIMNPFVEADDILDELEQFQPYKLTQYYDPELHGNAKLPIQMGTARNKRPRPMFLHDAESKTIEQLQHFARREMSMLTRKYMTAKYTIAGHTLRASRSPDAPRVVPVSDTVWMVEDEIGEVDEPMWLTSRTLKCSRGAGKTTDLELIRLNTMVL